MSRSKTGVVVAAAVAVVSRLRIGIRDESLSGRPDLLRHGRAAHRPHPARRTSDCQAVEAVVAYWNARGGVEADAWWPMFAMSFESVAGSPERSEVHQRQQVRRHLRLGNAAAAVATGAIASQAKIPFIALLTADGARRATAAVRLHPHGNGPVVRTARPPT